VTRQLTQAVPPAGDSLTVVMCAHREGRLLHPTFRAIHDAIEYALQRGRDVRMLVVLDRADVPTREFVSEALGPHGYFAGVCEVALAEVDFGDPARSRNAGAKRVETRFVAMVDADNLPSRTWFAAGLETLLAQDSQSIAHPSLLVTFGERSEIWPQCSSEEGYFRLGNLYDCNYWDTVSMAEREIYEQVPYHPTAPGTGIGYEDWHWNTVTLAQEIRHVIVPDTAYFYRIKRGDSVNNRNHAASSLIPASPLLTSTSVSARVRSCAAEQSFAPRPRPRRTPLQRQVLRAWRGKAPFEAAIGSSGGVRQHLWDGAIASPVNPDHYRLLYPDVEGKSDREVRRHYRTRGRAEGRRPRLSPAEVAALQ